MPTAVVDAGPKVRVSLRAAPAASEKARVELRVAAGKPRPATADGLTVIAKPARFVYLTWSMTALVPVEGF